MNKSINIDLPIVYLFIALAIFAVGQNSELTSTLSYMMLGGMLANITAVYDNADDKDAVDADTAMTYTVSDNKANVVYHLVPQRGLFIISSGGVWLARKQ